MDANGPLARHGLFLDPEDLVVDDATLGDIDQFQEEKEKDRFTERNLGRLGTVARFPLREWHLVSFHYSMLIIIKHVVCS